MKKIFGLLVLMMCIHSSPAFAQRYTIFPEFFSGNGWVCELFFTNQDFIGVSGVQILFYDKTGSPVSVDSNLGNATGYTFDLGPGATQLIQVNPEATYVEGYAVVTYPSNGSAVRATLVFRYVDGEGNVTVEAGVPQQEHGSQLTSPLGYHYTFPVEIAPPAGDPPQQSALTAVAIVNAEIFYSTSQTIIVSLIGIDGEIDATATIVLQPGEHFAGYLHEAALFPDFQDYIDPSFENYIGSVSISSPFGVGVLALRQDGNAFGAISTDGGPILGPFAVFGQDAIDEGEPNDSRAQAKLISNPTVISGTIGVQNDLDYFEFSGQTGDLVSVICDAALDGSLLDSVLEIRNSSDELIAENDQNGLSPELYPVADSFVQVVLPANDTYYIKVRDYFNNGGQDYYYTLYVRITPGD
jgi:hypothetical protein